MKKFALSFLLVAPAFLFAQTNMRFTNPEATDIVKAAYSPSNYAASVVFDDPHEIAAELSDRINTDSLHTYLLKMSTFETRHTSSDTLSAVRGIGATRDWALEKFEQFSDENENRLVVSFFEFDRDICGVTKHKNICALLPGQQLMDPGNAQTGIVIIEAHIDSRCDERCDTNCVAEGMEDNGSGSALVLELARVMSKYTFNRTILFMLTIGEEQGLYGAEAVAKYCKAENIPVAAVLNNDVIGGITCGETSSPPSCPGVNDIDSTQVRFFSSGTFNSSNKQLARYVKLQYKEELVQHVSVPMQLTIMTAEDRTGRGGDHIPFRIEGYPAMRFTSANEHGDASNGPNYTDRQHTSEDILGVDTDNDGIIDSFYVDFNYLARNAAINANAATMIAQNVCSDVAFTVEQINWRDVRMQIGGDWCPEPPYRIAIRTETNDWDTLITTEENDITFAVTPGKMHFFSIARVNSEGIESLFGSEQFLNIAGVEEQEQFQGIQLLQNRPNPFDESTAIAFIVHEMPASNEAVIRITDDQGRIIQELRKEISFGPNELLYDHGYGQVGTFYYTLYIDGKALDTKKMVFIAN